MFNSCRRSSWQLKHDNFYPCSSRHIFFLFSHQHGAQFCFDPLGHQACCGGNKVPSWPIFCAAFQATSRWHSAPAPLWTSAYREVYEHDWHPHGLIDYRTLFVNVIADVSDVSISDKPRIKWKDCARDFQCLLQFWLQSLPPLNTFFLLGSFFFFPAVCGDRWESALRKTVTFSDFPAYFPLLFRDTVAIHIPLFGDLSLLFFKVKAHCTEEDSFWQTSLCRHCIFMSLLWSSTAVSYLIFNFHPCYAIYGP